MNVRQLSDGLLEVGGTVVGVCDRILELYGVADRRPIHYQPIDAQPGGTPFQFTIPQKLPPVQQLRVELVNVATVWYAWELALNSGGATQ